jgi:hypothetical protein
VCVVAHVAAAARRVDEAGVHAAGAAAQRRRGRGRARVAGRAHACAAPRCAQPAALALHRSHARLRL